jgi:uncharacterized RDD family membrane protein YckC
MSLTPAGWYPDPEAPPGFVPLLRWWDGYQWTDHRQPPPSTSRPAGPATPDGQPLSGWWWRVLASLLDWILLTIVIYAVTLPVQSDIQSEALRLQEVYVQRLAAGESGAFGDYLREVMDLYYADHVLSMIVLPALITLVYHAGMLRNRGATLGKVVCRLRVRLREDDGRLPWSTIGARLAVQWGPSWVVGLAVALDAPLALSLVAGLAAGTFALVDPLCALGTRRQAIHDRAARTVVVRPR